MKTSSSVFKPPKLRRRQILAALPGVAVWSLFPQSAWSNAQRTPPALSEQWVSAAGDDNFELAWANGNRTHEFATGFRGHGMAAHPRRANTVVMFARRPGSMGVEVNLETGEKSGEFHCASGRVAVGHGCFSADGHRLYCAELDAETGEGKIVLRSADNYAWLGEFDSGGIGLHEVRMMPDGKTLVAANGGLLTRAESGREVLNLDTMDSSLCYLDSETGALLERRHVAEPKASIRHLDVAADGTVAIAMQMQRAAAGHQHLVALGALHRRGEPIKALAKPEAVITQLNDYMGSVAINNASRIAGFTSPRGNLAVFWHLDSGEFAGYHALRDVCGLGVSRDQRHFVLSSSIGQVRLLEARTLKEDTTRRLLTPDVKWDNHLLVVGGTA